MNALYLSELDAKSNIIPALIASQDDFISILKLSKGEPLAVFNVLEASTMPINLFLKHLCILADYGGEPIGRLANSMDQIFPFEDGKLYMDYSWNGRKYRYVFETNIEEFKSFRSSANKKLNIDGPGLINNVVELKPIYKDMIAILLHGGASDCSEDGGLSVCEIGSILGENSTIEHYVKEKYIFVSRITQGATSNSLGQLLQQDVISKLKLHLDESFSITRNGSIKLDGYNKTGGMPFDIKVEKDNLCIGIEVSFQVTTNSTIERKGGQAQDRYNLMKNNGFYIAYIIDGAGNFQRRSAISTICSYSDCTVAYSDAEIETLANWIKSVYA